MTASNLSFGTFGDVGQLGLCGWTFLNSMSVIPTKLKFGQIAVKMLDRNLAEAAYEGVKFFPRSRY